MKIDNNLMAEAYGQKWHRRAWQNMVVPPDVATEWGLDLSAD